MKKSKLFQDLEITETTPPEIDLLKDCEITDETEIEPQIPVIMIDDRRYLMQGDIAIITGEKKSGKSHVLRRILTTAIMPVVPIDFDSLHIQCLYSEKWIVYIDTEQHKSKSKETMQYCWRRAGHKSKPENFKMFNIRHLDTEKRANFIEQLIRKHKHEIHLIVIDGISDLVESINDEILSKRLAQTFFENDDAKISYVMAIHERKGGGGAMGWLGQHIEKKAGGGIRIEKDTKTDTHSINCSFLREDGNFKPIEFKYDMELHDFRLLDSQESEKLKQKAKEQRESEKRAEIENLIKNGFGGATELTKKNYFEMLTRIYPKQPVSEKTISRLLADAKKLELIIDDGKNYKLNF